MSIEIVSAADSRGGGKPPREIFPRLFAFPPNRDTLGGTAYLLIDDGGNILVDCPPSDEGTKAFLEEKGVAKIFLTHRGGHGQTLPQLQKALGCEVIVQEQEAYLLPSVGSRTFEGQVDIYPHCQGFWTCGHSPGSACLYWHDRDLGGILFTGRHLLPNQQGQPVPLRTSKTFHWPRQLKSVKLIVARFSPDTLKYICPGANTGFLRGKHSIESPYPSLMSLDLAVLGESVPII
ncbi:MAG: hypothetical protein N5P05_003270 [Chroococcopsis gigantea SAG 12.99]|jgi:glyoxylase-like metal-dependent hydrolase (beta-lactamase superfamily II)|nr:MBL fold metallo-hydrolase [Chlorogloea purpurea SAG 13.99]MDV3001664.1 hypothetical protein [Chroococcopsis gigantea SAG 12.99]